MFSRSCARDIFDALVFVRTCWLHAKSAQHKYATFVAELRTWVKATLPARLPSCHVEQKSQMTGCARPVDELVIPRLNSHGRTCVLSSNSMMTTPLLPLLSVTASSSVSAQSFSDICSVLVTKRRSRFKRGLMRAASISAAKVSSVRAFMLVPSIAKCAQGVVPAANGVYWKR